MSIRLPRIVLTPGCTFAIYILTGVNTGSGLPIPFDFDTHHEILDAHLWVEDNDLSDYVPPKVPPPILVHAPVAV